MEHAHLPLETLAKWLAGRLEQEDVLREVVPHLLERCPVCRKRHEEIQRLLGEVEHWDEEVALHESREAPALLARLTTHPLDEQARIIEEDEELHTWGLCQLLLRTSLEAVFTAPARALDLAEAAVRISRHLGEAYDRSWVLDLRARAYAYLGNARRILGELRSAEAAFRKAEGCLERSTSGNVRIEAEVLDLKSSLRRDQGRFGEALELSDKALSLYRESQDSHGIGIALLKKAKIFEEAGDLALAIELLENAPQEIKAAREPRLFACSRNNLLCALVGAGRHQEAEGLLPEVKELFRDTAQPLDRVRLRWAEGSIALGLGRLGEAEEVFREVQREFLERRMGINAALVSLDLAVLYAQEGRTGELKRLAVELMPVFEARDIHREALAALLLFQRACEEERTTAELARQVAELVRRRGESTGG